MTTLFEAIRNLMDKANPRKKAIATEQRSEDNEKEGNLSEEIKRLKIGSLFDGSGGFPLAGSMCGIEPTWAAEIEPYPIAVTRSRFPNVEHLGSVTDINGAAVEPVDVITFGSPCQDLSVAGKRAGLKHEANGDDETTRSGLFMEAVRIIKEMREATNGEFPSMALWENVPGAFSSNRGEDFRTVLEELIRIVEPTAIMPPVPEAGWPYADSYRGEGWSLAYRVFDAQHWGVPQRRRRIHLVLDLRGERAGKVLFEREGLRGNHAQGRKTREGTAADPQGGSEADGKAGTGFDGYNADITGDKAATLGVNCGMSTGRNGVIVQEGLDSVKVYAIDHAITTGGNCTAQGSCVYEDIQATLKASGTHAVAYGIRSCDSKAMKSANHHSGVYEADDRKGSLFEPRSMKEENWSEQSVKNALRAGESKVSHAVCVPYTTEIRSGCEGGGKGALIQSDLSATLATNNDQYLFQPVSKVTYDARGNGDGEIVSTLTGDHENRITDYTSVVCEPIPIHDQATRFAGKRGDKADGKGNGLGVGHPGEPMNTLTSADRHAVAFQTYQKVSGPLMANSHPGSYTGQDAFNDMLVAGVDCRNATELPEMTGSIQAGGHKSLNCNTVVRVRYIVRRLTPTECARLQGFPDKWGHPDHKDDFTDEEYSFWLNVRNTHAAINGKAVKQYTKEQMLKWYNGLHTDSAEYKMWGNGIALPPALYCMQGIAEMLTKEDGCG